MRQGGFVPLFGDLNGDGAIDAVLKLNDGIRENQPDPGLKVEIEAFLSGGRFLWRRALMNWDDCFGNPNNVPAMIYDLDGDGRGEAITRLEEAGVVYLAVLDGMTGRTLAKTPWAKMLTDHSRTSSRIHMAIAYLDGRSPAIITQTGIYENELVDAYDSRLRHLWQYRSVAETSGGGSHHLEIADVDGDGRDEVFCGDNAIGPDGKLRWSLYRQHPDVVLIQHILPGARNRQVFFGFERELDAGVYLVDARTGELIWKVSRDDDPRWVHVQTGWASNIWEGSPGLEIMANRDGHTEKDITLFAAGGQVLMDPFPPGWQPVNWTGTGVRDLMSRDGSRLGRFTGQGVEPLKVQPPRPAGQGIVPHGSGSGRGFPRRSGVRGRERGFDLQQREPGHPARARAPIQPRVPGLDGAQPRRGLFGVLRVGAVSPGGCVGKVAMKLYVSAVVALCLLHRRYPRRKRAARLSGG